MQFLKQLSLYTLVGIVSAGINFFLMPILSHYMMPADYGLLALFNTYVTILVPIISISAYSLLNVDYFKQKSKQDFAARFTSLQIIPLVNAALLFLVVLTSYSTLAPVLELSAAGPMWGYVILGLSLLTIFTEQLFQFLINQKKAAAFAIFSLSKVALEVSLTFYLVTGQGLGWQGRMWSWVIVTAVYFIVALWYFKKQGFLSRDIKWQYIREGIVFGSPLVLHGIGKFVINQSDRLFIVKMVPNGLDEAGIYSIGYTVGSLIMIVVNAFFNFFTPFLMERLSNLTEDGKLQVVKMGYGYALGCVIMLIAIYFITPLFFRYFIDQRYLSSVPYVFWVALGYCFWGGYMFFSGIVFYLKRSRILGWLALFNVSTNLLFNYFFVQYFGALGAAYATALSFLLVMLIVSYISQRLQPLPWTMWIQASKRKSLNTLETKPPGSEG